MTHQYWAKGSAMKDWHVAFSRYWRRMARRNPAVMAAVRARKFGCVHGMCKIMGHDHNMGRVPFRLMKFIWGGNRLTRKEMKMLNQQLDRLGLTDGLDRPPIRRTI